MVLGRGRIAVGKCWMASVGVGWPWEGVQSLGKVFDCLMSVLADLRKVLDGLGKVLDGLGKVSDTLGKMSVLAQEVVGRPWDSLKKV